MVSRRTLLEQAVVRLTQATIVVAVPTSLVALLSGCGGQGTSSAPPPDPGHIVAQINDGSVFDNTNQIFQVVTRTDPNWPYSDKRKVIELRHGSRSILAGEELVFEVNGQWQMGSDNSAYLTKVQAGDIISWKTA